MRNSASGDDRLDAALSQEPTVLVEVVAPVGEQLPRPVTGATGHSADPRDRVEQGQQLGDVVAVATGQGDGERGAACVGDDVVLRAGPGTVDRARPGFG